MCNHEIQSHVWENNMLVIACMECNKVLHTEDADEHEYQLSLVDNDWHNTTALPNMPF